MSPATRRKGFLAAIMIMAMSAVGPGFITQTATFTAKLGAAFAFAILASVIIDFVVQLNIWRVVTVTKMRASEIANAAIPGSGYLLSVLVIIGGLFFNIGNIAGAGLGLHALLGADPKIGGVLAALVAIGIFLSKRAGIAMDRVVLGAGIIKLILVVYACIAAAPPSPRRSTRLSRPARSILPPSPPSSAARSAAISRMRARIACWIRARSASRICRRRIAPPSPAFSSRA